MSQSIPISLFAQLNEQTLSFTAEMSYLRQLPYVTAAKGLVLSSFVTMCDRQQSAHKNEQTNRHPSRSGSPLRSHYTHVILGFGTAGSSATQELLTYAGPADSVLVVDPIANIKKIGFPQQEDKRLVFEQSQATNIDHVHKIIELADGSRVRYHNCLISVGSTAAPFNPQYVDADCDLQQTVVDLTHPNAPHDLYLTLVDEPGSEHHTKGRKNAKSIALVGGNSWDSVELAGRLAMAAEHKHHEQVLRLQQLQKLQAQQRAKALSQLPPSNATNGTSTNTNTKTSGGSKGATNLAPAALTPPLPVPGKDTISLIYPAYGPMSHTLPRYLSLAVAKRLHGLGVHLVPYSYVRYLGATTSSTNTTNTAHSKGYTTTNPTTNTTTTISTTDATNTPQAVLFLAKTYDSLNTQSITADKVTFAPTSIPTTQDRTLLNSHATHTNNSKSPSNSNKTQHSDIQNTSKPTLNEFHPHGFLLRSGLELDRITGGVAANMSLQVCEGVFVAGDVASVYCSSGGGVDLSGSGDSGDSGRKGGVCVGQQRGVIRGYHNALYSGTVAGRNMAYSTTNHTTTTSNASSNTNTCTPLLYNHIPVYETHSADIGVHFTFIGNCSSALETHGYWWKLAGKDNGTGNGTSNGKTANNGGSGVTDAIMPPLGLGVVFYIDNNTIVGVLISGLPTAPNYVHTVSVSGSSSSNTGSLTYTDHIHTLCKALIGKSVKALDAYTNTSSTSNGTKAIDISSAYELPTEDVVSSDEAAAYERSISSTDAADATANINTANGNATTLDSPIVEVYTSQVLSWEARRLISPVLSAPLYKQHPNTAITHKSDNNTYNTQLHKQISSYPRPLYRYCGPSHTTIKDLTEPHTHAIIQPTVIREALFQPEFANTGSRADNVKTAYKRSMAKDLY